MWDVAARLFGEASHNSTSLNKLKHKVERSGAGRSLDSLQAVSAVEQSEFIMRGDKRLKARYGVSSIWVW